MLPMHALVPMTDTDFVGFKTPMTMPQASSKDIGRGITLSGKSCCGSIAICRSRSEVLFRSRAQA